MNEEILEWSIDDFVEVTLQSSDDFLKIRETLSRIGITSKEANILYQSCHILHKSGRYYIVHFKELFVLDGKPSTITLSDIQRRNTIVQLLSDWNLLSVIDAKKIENKCPVKQLKIIPFKDKHLWVCQQKYTLGKYKSVLSNSEIRRSASQHPLN